MNAHTIDHARHIAVFLVLSCFATACLTAQNVCTWNKDEDGDWANFLTPLTVDPNSKWDSDGLVPVYYPHNHLPGGPYCAAVIGRTVTVTVPIILSWAQDGL